MQNLFARIFAILLTLQPWAFGAMATPRPKGSSPASSLSSPNTRDQTLLESGRSTTQPAPSSTRDAALPPKLPTYLETPKYLVVSSHQSPVPEAVNACALARFSRWLE